jgi:uncharacterized protein involved in exopolysaccharide biosynthesis
MNETPWRDEEVSLFAVGTVLLRNRWRILRWTLGVGAFAIVLAVLKPVQYPASASFLPQNTDANRSGLASLAGQFGLTFPISNQALSPDFYALLVKARPLLLPIVNDTFTVAEMGGRKVPFQQLFKIRGDTPAQRDERGVARLSGIIGTSIGKTTGVVSVSVTTKWPSVSLAIVQRLVDAVDEFNQNKRKSQASSERKFVEGRLGIAASDLRTAEDRLQSFLQINRVWDRSPELSFEHDRLQREVTFQQQVYSSLAQSLEEARVREVRDTPVITIVEPPSVVTMPGSSGRVLFVLFGLFLGTVIGAMLVLASEAMRRRRKDGDVEAEEFAGTLGEVKGAMLGPVRTLRERIRR